MRERIKFKVNREELKENLRRYHDILKDIGLSVLESGNIAIRAVLKEGRHLFEICEGVEFIVDCPQKTHACFLGSVEKQGETAVFNGGTLELSPPVLLPNVPQTLVGISGVGAIVGEFEEIMSIIQEMGYVVLSKVSFQTNKGIGFEINPKFSGYVMIRDRIPIPFWDYEIPSLILPRLRGDLSGLFSNDPIASGRKIFLKIPSKKWDILENAIEEMDTTFEFVINTPICSSEIKGSDLTTMKTDIYLPSPLSVSGESKTLFNKGQIHGEIRGLTIRWKDHSINAHIPFDFEISDHSSLAGDCTICISEGSIIPHTKIQIKGSNPLIVGGASLDLEFENIEIGGHIGFSLEKGEKVESLGIVTVTTGFSAFPQVFSRSRTSCFSGEIKDGALEAKIEWSSDGQWKLAFSGKTILDTKTNIKIAPIPEFKLNETGVEVIAKAYVKFSGVANHEKMHGEVELRIEKAVLSIGNKSLEIPENTYIKGTFILGEPFSEEIQEVVADLEWDFHNQSCKLIDRVKTAEIQIEGASHGGMRIRISPSGRITVEKGPLGIEAMRLLGTLLDPGSNNSDILEILKSDQTARFVEKVLSFLDEDLSYRFAKLRNFIDRIQRHIKEEGISQIGDLIPRQKIARILSKILCGDDRLVTRLEPLIKRVTEGDGLDIKEAKAILRDIEGLENLDYEIDSMLRWLNIVLKPSGAIERARAKVELPLVEQYRDKLKNTLSANQIAALSEIEDRELEAKVKETAPYLTIAQLEHCLENAKGWSEDTLEWLEFVRDIKKKVAVIDEGHGGVTFPAQAAMIGKFIIKAVGQNRWHRCALGPQDIAILLHAGLAEGRQGVQAQINNRILIEAIKERDGEFLKEVLVEMSHGVSEILTHALFAFLHQDQDEMQNPLDLPGLLEEKLGVNVPRRLDYVAGGPMARESYYEALSNMADHILENAKPYLARRAYIREVNHPVFLGSRPSGLAKRLEDEAKKAVAAADKLGFTIDFDQKESKTWEEARQAYRVAFDACAMFLKECREGFQRGWLKQFWARNEEALKVLSVVRNYQEDIDDVRRYIRVCTGKDFEEDEQSLIKDVINTLYYYEKDKKEVMHDPLVRLLIDPECGEYDFTVISAMGVVTDGERGHELEDAYRRLEEKRGIKVIRAHTGLFRSLEYNASMIIKAIQQVQGKWGWIGYSQGCANGLCAESFLRGGSPKQQEMIERLVCRNLLYSAGNGSVHGTSGAIKFRKAMIEGERFLKHYQAFYSKELIDLVLRAMRSIMQSSLFTNTLMGAHSLSLERAIALHRDGQFAYWVPTSTTRGIINLDNIPEALEYLYFLHEKLLPSVPSDSQVAAEDAVGHATRVRNERTEMFARCEIPSRIQATHHWSPLTKEIEIVTTQRDKERAVYQSPKDRHVFPWIDVNIRFGRIEKKVLKKEKDR